MRTLIVQELNQISGGVYYYSDSIGAAFASLVGTVIGGVSGLALGKTAHLYPALNYGMTGILNFNVPQNAIAPMAVMVGAGAFMGSTIATSYYNHNLYCVRSIEQMD